MGLRNEEPHDEAYSHLTGAGKLTGKGQKVVNKNPCSNFIQLTSAPTPSPSDDKVIHKELSKNSHTDDSKPDEIDEQNLDDAMPTKQPTAFPTKMTHNQKGSKCCAETEKGEFCKYVGWAGAGPGKDYCNVWKCEVGESTFSTTKKYCSVPDFNDKITFCSHTTCTFVESEEAGTYKVGDETITRKVIQVRSDHREEEGGHHTCGFSKKKKPHRREKRPACDCVCEGDRRQDAAGFEREINEFHTVGKKPKQPLVKVGKNKKGRNQEAKKLKDATTNLASNEAWDEKFNTNNFYSSHNNAERKAKKAPNGVSQYSEKDQSYVGGRTVAHPHYNTGN